MLHLSLDDTKGIFKALCTESLSSIFETRTLAYLKKMNYKYGTCFYLFCTCADDTYSLKNVSDKYKNEFLLNENWLKFGFHCYKENLSYVAGVDKNFENDYCFFNYHIKRITGQKNKVDALRLHGFQGTEHICDYLHKQGIKILFTADDQRKSYYLNKDAMLSLETHGLYFDEKIKMTFIKSCIRLENAEDIWLEMDNKKRRKENIISVFTHEWQMDRKDIREKIELCCKWGVEHNET